MQEPLFKKHNTSNPESFVESTKTSKELLQKELNVNKAEQVLLGKRIILMQELAKDLPPSDPRQSEIILAIQMDQVELDELKMRESILSKKLQELENFRNFI